MPIVVNNTLNQIRSIATGGDDRVAKAKRLAELIRKLGEYRWVGIYDVGAERCPSSHGAGRALLSIRRFPVNKGSPAWRFSRSERSIVGDVRNEPRYLTTFGSTLSEIIVPVISPGGEHVIGTVDVESEHANAFSARDQQMIEQCAQAALPLWLLR